jgi:hypothetical protein
MHACPRACRVQTDTHTGTHRQHTHTQTPKNSCEEEHLLRAGAAARKHARCHLSDGAVARGQQAHQPAQRLLRQHLALGRQRGLRKPPHSSRSRQNQNSISCQHLALGRQRGLRPHPAAAADNLELKSVPYLCGSTLAWVLCHSRKLPPSPGTCCHPLSCTRHEHSLPACAKGSIPHRRGSKH